MTGDFLFKLALIWLIQVIAAALVVAWYVNENDE